MRRFSRQSIMCRLLAGAALLAVAGPALAADEGEPEDVIVNGQRVDAYTPKTSATGSKTDVPLKDVPAAIVVIPVELLRDQGAETMNDALANASSVAPTYGGGYGLADNYAIRGLAMRFLRDGLPDGPTFMGYRRTLTDIQSIEVLKGPGSALYGRAEAGGSVNLTTKAPLDRLAAEAAVSYSRFDNWDLSADLTGPLAKGVNGRIIGHYERSDGFRGLSTRLTEVLPTLSFALGARNLLTVDYDYRDASNVVDNFGIPFTTARKLADVDRGTRIYSPFNRVDQTIHRVTVKDEYQANELLKLRAAVIYDNRDVNVIRDGGARLLDPATNRITGRNGRYQGDKAEYWTGQFEAVLTPTTGAVKHTILLGAEYADSNVKTVRRNYNLGDITFTGGVPSVPNATVPTTTTLSFDRTILSDSLSVYGQEHIDISNVVKIRAGVRYDSVKLADLNNIGATAAAQRGTRDLLSWQAGAVYQPADWLSFYGGYSAGQYISIQTESSRLSPIPEDSSQIEAGIKTELLGGKLNANVALFETRRDNYFVTLTPGADPVQEGRQRSRGVELDLIGAPAKGLTFIANFAYIDAINRSNALGSVIGLAPSQSTFGKRLGSTPKTSGALWANYALTDGPLAGLGFGAGFVYKGDTFVDSLELLKVPSYTIYRAALSYRAKHFDLQVSVNNLTDKTYYTVPTFIGALPGEPRSVKLTLRARI